MLATGYLVGIVEWACMLALAGHLDTGEQPLGVHPDLSHDAPTPPGCPLTVQVGLPAVDGRQLSFAVHAAADAATVCRGAHRRTVINAARFRTGARGFDVYEPAPHPSTSASSRRCSSRPPSRGRRSGPS
ncbi:thioesterase family protein [Pseudonocardia sp. T1-2H]|uniref:thioesterase family protein n=1 Tax=Pseudonocardia sp. T1-2H TaxID=3128899 RepID=UPI003100C977